MLRPGHKKPRLAGRQGGADGGCCPVCAAPTATRGRRGRRESGAGRGVRAARAGRAGRKAPPRRAARHNAKRESLRGAGRGAGRGRSRLPGARRGQSRLRGAGQSPRREPNRPRAGVRGRGGATTAGGSWRGGPFFVAFRGFGAICCAEPPGRPRAGSCRAPHKAQSAAKTGGGAGQTECRPVCAAPAATRGRRGGTSRARGAGGAACGQRARDARDAKRRPGGRRVTMQSGKASAGRGAARDGVGLGCPARGGVSRGCAYGRPAPAAAGSLRATPAPPAHTSWPRRAALFSPRRTPRTSHSRRPRACAARGSTR